MKPAVRKILIAAAAVAVPAALLAQDQFIDVLGYGWFGSSHSGPFNGTLAVGFNNVVSIGSPGTGTAAIGTGLQAPHPNSLVVGQYNSPALSGSYIPLFVVGNGESATARRNALEVWSDGTLVVGKVPEKGGVPMGEFTAN